LQQQRCSHVSPAAADFFLGNFFFLRLWVVLRVVALWGGAGGAVMCLQFAVCGGARLSKLKTRRKVKSDAHCLLKFWYDMTIAFQNLFF
jgi:hypothetical protein